MIEITSENEIDYSGKVVLKFHADWCGPCKRMEPVVEKLEQEFSDIKFYSIDSDQAVELTKKYNIRSIPDLRILKDGTEQHKIIGLSLISPLRKILRELE